MDELQALYDSEINFSLSCFYDHGFEWKLGDVLNGFKAEGVEPTLKKAVGELYKAVVREYPTSDWVRRHQA